MAQWTVEEKNLLIYLVARYGRRFALLSKYFQNRDRCQLKSQYNFLCKNFEKKMKECRENRQNEWHVKS